MKQSDKDTMRRFLREVEIMRSLRHPNIVEFMGVCIEQPNICIVTEYLKKGSLHDLLRERKGKWTWKRYLHVAQDIVRGLMWLHRKGIIHRDLSKNKIHGLLLTGPQNPLTCW
jgi:serine/threonine protein kinase